MMELYGDIHTFMHKTKKKEVNNSHESDHSPTMPHGPFLRLIHILKGA